MPTKVRTVNLSKKDRQFLKLASAVAENSEMRFRHAAVIVRGGNVLSVGYNKLKNHPDIIEEDKILPITSFGVQNNITIAVPITGYKTE